MSEGCATWRTIAWRVSTARIGIVNGRNSRSPRILQGYPITSGVPRYGVGLLRRFLEPVPFNAVSGRNHSETWAGSIVLLAVEEPVYEALDAPTERVEQGGDHQGGDHYRELGLLLLACECSKDRLR